MKILIGTPIHQVKDYSMQRWLENVSRLKYPADLLMVDNSPGTDYVKKVKGYCKKIGLKHKIKYLEFDQNLSVDIKIEASQETVRQYVLANDYDAWFSWECDQLIPNNALDRLVQMMNSGDYMVVFHNSWARWDPTILNTNMGCTLIRRECLEKNWFLPTKAGKISLGPADGYNINDPTVYKRRILESGGNYVEVYGKIKPIKHLEN